MPFKEPPHNSPLRRGDKQQHQLLVLSPLSCGPSPQKALPKFLVWPLIYFCWLKSPRTLTGNSRTSDIMLCWLNLQVWNLDTEDQQYILLVCGISHHFSTVFQKKKGLHFVEIQFTRVFSYGSCFDVVSKNFAQHQVAKLLWCFLLKFYSFPFRSVVHFEVIFDGEGQGSLVCCSPWAHKEVDMTERLNKNNSEV